jgi:hypothetical protein
MDNKTMQQSIEAKEYNLLDSSSIEPPTMPQFTEIPTHKSSHEINFSERVRYGVCLTLADREIKSYEAHALDCLTQVVVQFIENLARSIKIKVEHLTELDFDGLVTAVAQSMDLKFRSNYVYHIHSVNDTIQQWIEFLDKQKIKRG